MEPLDYAQPHENPAVEYIGCRQELCIATALIANVTALFVGLLGISDAVFLACCTIFIVSNLALAVMLIRWRRFFCTVVLVVAWVWVGLEIIPVLLFCAWVLGLIR